MRVLHRKLFRELAASRGLLLLIASIIATGVMCFVAMQSAYLNLSFAKARYYRLSRMADFWVDVKKMPLTELSQLRRLPGVAQLQSRIQMQATVDLPGVVEPINATVISMPDRRRPVLNALLIQQGDYFGDERRNEVIVSDKFARQHRLYPGNELQLVLNRRRERFVIVGTAISSEYAYLVGAGSLLPDPEHFGVLYIKRSHAEDLNDSDGAANQLVGRVAPTYREHLPELLDRFEGKLEPYGVFATTPLKDQQSNLFLTEEIEGLGAVATVVPVIFLAVAALVLNILMQRMARRQRMVVGTLKALGYGNQAIFWHFLTFGLVVGFLGGIGGSLLGYLASAGMTAVYRIYFEFPDLRNGFYWQTHAIGMLISVLCAVAGTLHGSQAMLRLRPAEAMRPEPPQQSGRVWLERLMGPLWQQLSAGWRMALRGCFRHRLRTATSLFAATMGAGLLVTCFMMVEAQGYLIDFTFYQEMRSDIDLVFDGEKSREALFEVQRLPGVAAAEPVLHVACDFVHGPRRRKGAVTGLVDQSQLTVPRRRDGERIVIPASGLVLTARLAELLDADIGDRITMVPVKGEQRPVEVTVARIADSFMGMSAYASLPYLSSLVGEPFVMTGAQLRIGGSEDDLQSLYTELKQMSGVETVQARRDMVKMLETTLLQNQYAMIGVMIVFSGVVFFGSIVNASMVSLAERQSEVATLRALGYSPWRVGGLFFRESVVVNFTGALLGLPAGYCLTLLTAASYANDILRLPVVSAPWIWGYTLVLAIGFTLAAQGVVQFNILRLNVLEGLKAKE